MQTIFLFLTVFAFLLFDEEEAVLAPESALAFLVVGRWTGGSLGDGVVVIVTLEAGAGIRLQGLLSLVLSVVGAE